MAVNLGSSTVRTRPAYAPRSTQRHIVKSSNGTLVLFANIDNIIRYKISTDDGDTWSASWSNLFTPSTSAKWNGFDVYIDDNDDIHTTFTGIDNDQPRWYYRKLSYSEGSWSLGAYKTIAPFSVLSPKFAIRANGDFWVASPTYIYYSTDLGETWSIIGNPTSSVNVSTIIPVGNDIWYIVQRLGTLAYFVYTTSFGSIQTIESSGITSSNVGLGSLKISDSNIWVSGRTSSGAKVYHYNGSSWDSGELISSNLRDYAPALSNINGNPVAVLRGFTETQNDIVYYVYNGDSWGDKVNITNDKDEDFHVTCLDSDSTTLYVDYVQGSGTSFTVYFDKVVFLSKIQLTPSIEWNATAATRNLLPTLEWEVSKVLELNTSLEWVSKLSHKFIPNIVNYPFYFQQLSIQSSYSTLGLSGCLAGYSLYMKNSGTSGSTILGIYADNVLKDTITISANTEEYQTLEYFNLDSILNPKDKIELRILSVATGAEDLKLELYVMTFPFELECLFFGNLDNNILVTGLDADYFFNASDYWTIEFNQPIKSIDYLIGVDINEEEHTLDYSIINGLFYQNRIKITPSTDTDIKYFKLRVLDYNSKYKTFEYSPIIKENYIEYLSYISDTSSNLTCFISPNFYRYSFDDGTSWSVWDTLDNNQITLSFSGQSVGDKSILIQYKIGTEIISNTINVYYVTGSLTGGVSFYGNSALLSYSDSVPLDHIEIYNDDVLIETKSIPSIEGFDTLTLNETTGIITVDNGTLYYDRQTYSYTSEDISLIDINIEDYDNKTLFLFLFGFDYLTREFDYRIIAVNDINLDDLPILDNFINIKAIYFFVKLLQYPIVTQQIEAKTEDLEYVFQANNIDLSLKNSTDITIKLVDRAGREYLATNEFIKTKYNVWRMMNIYDPDTDEEILPGQIHQKDLLTITLSTEDWGDNPDAPVQGE